MIYSLKSYFQGLNNCLETEIILWNVLLHLPCDSEEISLCPDISGKSRRVFSLELCQKGSKFQTEGMCKQIKILQWIGFSWFIFPTVGIFYLLFFQMLLKFFSFPSLITVFQWYNLFNCFFFGVIDKSLFF